MARRLRVEQIKAGKEKESGENDRSTPVVEEMDPELTGKK